MSVFKDFSDFYNVPIFHRGKLLRKLREEWANPEEKWRDYSKIKQLLLLTTDQNQKGLIDDKTWHDLGMNAVFESVDVAQSEIGQQKLYKNMHLLEESDERLQKKYKLAVKLKDEQHLRESLQVALYPVSFVSGKACVDLLFKPFNLPKMSKKLAITWFVFSVCIFLCSVFLKLDIFYVFLLLIIATNFFISRRFLSLVEPYSVALNHLKTILSVSYSICQRKESHSLEAFNPVKEQIKSVRHTKRILSLLLFSQHAPNFMINYPMFFVNLFIPVDVLFYSLLINSVEKRLQTMRLCFESIGEIDSSIALASYLYRFPNHCYPEISEEWDLSFKNVRHPLVTDCVPNTFRSQEKSAMITGSNMAGKTTFIRVMGINILLARTFWLSHAENAIIPRCNIASSISNSDFLEEGKSYYFSELEHINRFLHLSAAQEPYLFLIDEIFRGTNTVERIGGSAAVLQKLAVNSVVFVTTHDRELEDYLSPTYSMFHFQETGDTEKPFDYKIRPGVCKSRNALKLMASLGFPESIVEKAQVVANEIDQKYSDVRYQDKNKSHLV